MSILYISYIHGTRLACELIILNTHGTMQITVLPNMFKNKKNFPSSFPPSLQTFYKKFFHFSFHNDTPL